MAEVIRSAKSRSVWTRIELMAYNIKIVPQTPEQFFGAAAAGVSLAELDPLIVTGSADTANLSDTALRYLTYLDLAADANQETLIDEFSLQTLDLLGYSERGLALFNRYNIPNRRGDGKNAETDVCLVDGRTLILLILQEDKTVFSSSNPEPQVVAEAIAAYQYNNDKRERMGMTTLDKMVLPCITMVGTRPTFYLVPVNRALSNAVTGMTGQYPHEPTEVWKCATVVGHNRSSMEKPEYRRVALERFMAFRTLAKHHWEKFLM